MSKQISINELLGVKTIEKLKEQVGVLSGQLAEAQAKAELYRDSLMARENELSELKTKYEPDSFKTDEVEIIEAQKPIHPALRKQKGKK